MRGPGLHAVLPGQPDAPDSGDARRSAGASPYRIHPAPGPRTGRAVPLPVRVNPAVSIQAMRGVIPIRVWRV